MLFEKGETMKKYYLEKKIKIFFLIFILLGNSIVFVTGLENPISPDKDLPQPMDVKMILETSIFRRMSIREFTEEPVTDEELSTILWAAYGLRDDGNRTISKINGTHAAIIYVLNEEAAYKYDPDNHSLVVYKDGDHRDDINILQYPAPIQLGLCWDTNKADPNQAGFELGQIGQNIQFMANALELGTVVTGQTPPAIKPLGLPPNEEGMIVMPLGHPKVIYNFINRPMWISTLPKIKESSTTISTALKNIVEGDTFEGQLSQQELSQIIWSSYGFSNFIDQSEQKPIHLKRHRTVPSAHGYYPLVIYAITNNGIYRYYPNILMDIILNYLHITSAPVDFFGLPIITFLKKTRDGDFRQDIALLSSQANIASSPLILIPVLDIEMTKELSMESAKRFWYYEAGATAHNIMLEATAWDLTAKICYPINSSAILSILDLSNDYIPMTLIPVGS
jgi:nitroreductase